MQKYTFMPTLRQFLDDGKVEDAEIYTIAITRLCEMAQWDPSLEVRQQAIKGLREMLSWEPMLEVKDGYLCLGPSQSAFRVSLGEAEVMQRNYWTSSESK